MNVVLMTELNVKYVACRQRIVWHLCSCVVQSQMSAVSGPGTSTFKHGYEDSDVMQNTTAGQIDNSN